MSMFNRIFGKPKEQANSSALATLDKLNEVTFLFFFLAYDYLVSLPIRCFLGHILTFSYFGCLYIIAT
jgi:hypothetical protein